MTEPQKKTDLGSMTQWQLIRLRFSKHRVARFSLYVLIVIHVVAVFGEFFSPYHKASMRLDYRYCPPQLAKFSLRHGLYCEAVVRRVDPITLRDDYGINSDHIVPLGFLVKGDTYRLFGLFTCNRHFLGVDHGRLKQLSPDATGTFFVLGADKYGQCLLSRIINGGRISLFVGLLGVVFTFVLGVILGGISGYAGGRIDNMIQRTIEIINSFPKLPLWLALGAAMPRDWSVLKVYFMITLVLSIMGWTGLARVVRGRILALREEDYATAARLLGASHGRIVLRHLLPGFTSHMIVALTLALPGMILGETALSFLGLGLRPPAVSWGVLLQDCMNLEAVTSYPWLLMPAVMIVATVMSYNFLGDGLRDAADPYATH
ncbi:MAG: ABC transporter permease [Verrucomicrobia bacterium]|nr:ABC transporter permease [Verrucomicrobiota bacterium]